MSYRKEVVDAPARMHPKHLADAERRSRSLGQARRGQPRLHKTRGNQAQALLRRKAIELDKKKGVDRRIRVLRIRSHYSSLPRMEMSNHVLLVCLPEADNIAIRVR